MAKSKLPLFIIGGIVIILLFAMVSTYNSLVSKEEKVKLQWNEVQNVYQRRLDLIPNIVNVVKGAADFEQTTLEKITETRTRASQVTLSANEATATTSKRYKQHRIAWHLRPIGLLCPLKNTLL
jgi:LemA protein